MSAASTVSIAPAPVAKAAMPARGDSLATGVAFMLVLNIVQRGIGFVRGLLFCRYLSEAALGQFSLANSFVLLAAPLMVLGLPGSMGRYIEYYRQRGQLQAYLRKLTIVTMSLTGLGLLAMTALAEPLTYWLFDDPAQLRLMMYTLATLGLVAAFNFLNEFLTAIRQVRALSWMQFVNSLAFTIAGIALVFAWESTAEAIVVAYGISCIVAVAAIVPWYREIYAEFSHDANPLAKQDIWSKLLPFAAWVWLTNLVTNVADFVDRFMILHVSGLDSHAAQALIGQYHSSRVVPLLIATLGATIAGIVLPHWSQAWESGEREKVSRDTNLGVKLISVMFTAGSLMVLVGSPLLFDWVLAGKYSDGLAALPWALVGAIWFSALIVAQNYLLCAEQAKLVTAACLLGVIVNIGLNFVALPWGLSAILAARAWATLVVAVAIVAGNVAFGMRWNRGLLIALVLPLLALLPMGVAAMLLVGILVLDWRLHWLFSLDEQSKLRSVSERLLDKVKQKLGIEAVS